jgi:putative ABC transport system permease protein
MFRNYLLSALRNFLGHRLSALINVGGLTVGLTCAIVIMLFARDELSYDKWIPGSANLYRLELTFTFRGRDPWPLASAPFPALRAMQDHIPEVTAATHLVPETMTVTYGERQFSETVAVVDPGFFQVIRLPLIAGDPATVFAQPESIVLSETAARKYFGDTDPLGKVVTVTGEGVMCNRSDTACKNAIYPITVTGIMRNLPANSHLAAELVMSNESRADGLPRWFRDEAWTSTNGSYDYIALAPGADPAAVLAKFKPVLDQSAKTDFAPVISQIEQYRLTRFWDAHLTSDKYGGMKPPGSFTTVYGFLIIAALILLIACVNFTNLATVQATLRAREISLRKVMGARRDQLIVQFLGEALLMALVALILALALVEPLLLVFDRFLNKSLAFHYLSDWPLLLAVIGIAVAAGLLGGLYPALVLSNFRPAAVLRTNAARQSGSGLLRAGLVVLQFAVSIGLGIAAVVVFAQVSFARHLDSGFERDGIVVVGGLSKLTTSAVESFSAALKANPGIAEVAPSNGVPLDLFNVSNLAIQIEGKPETFTAHVMSASPEFPLVYGMRLIAGRLLSRSRGQDVFSEYPFYPPDSAPQIDDGRNLLINAEAARRFGYTAQDAVGKTVVCNGHRATIVGVLENSMLDGAKESVMPTVYAGYGGGNTLLSIRIHGGRTADTLSFIDKTWRSFAPGSTIQRYFLTEAFDKQFQADEKQGVLFGLFVAIAVFIACLGLFGLAAFAAERRTKEIGIRKAFGAGTHRIVLLLLWQFSIPVLLANLIAWPLAYYYLHRWLEGYAYRIALSPLYFVAAGVAALLIAWATQYAHALRVARANPIHALRYE